MSDEPQQPLACRLSETQKEDRRPKVEALFVERLEEVTETDAGYAFKFDADSDNLQRVFEFVDAERKCCPFFQFDITVPADEQPVRLEIGGSERVKAFVADNMLPEIERRSTE